MDLVGKPNGKWKLRWNEGGRKRARTFDRKGDAIKFEADRIRRKQLGQAAIPGDQPLREFVETYWRLHAPPNLAPSTRALYARTWANHILPRLGDYGVRELTPKRLARFREELEKAQVGPPTVVKAMSIVQGIVSFAVAEELVEYNAAASVRKPRYERAREPQIFLPPDVEKIRAKLGLRDRTLVSVLAYSGPRPEEVVCRLGWDDVGERTIRYRDQKRRGQQHRFRFTPLLAPLAEDLRECFSPAAARAEGHQCSRRTTAGSGGRTIGATGASAFGMASQSDRVGTASEPYRRGRVARPPARAHGICARAL
jgi:integrase